MNIRLTNDAQYIFLQFNSLDALCETHIFLTELAMHKEFSTIETETDIEYFLNDDSFSQHFLVSKNNLDSAKFEADLNRYFNGNERAAYILGNIMTAYDINL